MRQTLRELAGSILFAVAAIGLVLGGISLALAEGFIPVASNPFPSATPFLLITTFPTSSAQITIETLPVALPSETSTSTPVACTPPAGWVAVQVDTDDTLVTLSIQYQTTMELLSQANCLASNVLVPGTQLYVPPASTPTLSRCGPPGGWIIYAVRPGETLYSLSQAYDVSIAQLQQANCISSGQISLATGQQIWVPNVARGTPLPTRTASLTPVSIIFPTLTSSLPTNEPTATATATPTPTATATQPPTSTQPPTATQPPTPTATITSFP
jgi:LysM repeat protein